MRALRAILAILLLLLPLHARAFLYAVPSGYAALGGAWAGLGTGLSAGGNVVTNSGVGWTSARSSVQLTGKVYWEATNVNATAMVAGFAPASMALTAYPGQAVGVGYALSTSNNFLLAGSASTLNPGALANPQQTLGVALDTVTGKLFLHNASGWFGAGGTAADPVAETNGISVASYLTGNDYAYASLYTAGEQLSVSFTAATPVIDGWTYTFQNTAHTSASAALTTLNANDIVVAVASYIPWSPSGGGGSKNGAICDAINQRAGGTLAIDGSANAQTLSGTSVAIALTTTQANDVIVVSALANSGGTVSVSDTSHLTWAQRAVVGQGGGTQINEFYAISSGVLTADSITVAITGSATVLYAAAFGVAGANAAAPYDPSPVNPNVAASGSCYLAAYNPNAMLLVLSRGTSLTVDTGFSAVPNAPPAMLNEYKIVTTPYTAAVSDAAALAWSRRGASFVIGGGSGFSTEEWWAAAASVLTGDTITMTAPGGNTYPALIISAYGLKGINASSPFDPNGALPGHVTAYNGTCSVSTSNGNDLLIANYFFANFDATPGAGWGTAVKQTNSMSEYQAVGVTQSGTAAAITAPGSIQGGVCDALQLAPIASGHPRLIQ